MRIRKLKPKLNTTSSNQALWEPSVSQTTFQVSTTRWVRNPLLLFLLLLSSVLWRTPLKAASSLLFVPQGYQWGMHVKWHPTKGNRTASPLNTMTDKYIRIFKDKEAITASLFWSYSFELSTSRGRNTHYFIHKGILPLKWKYTHKLTVRNSSFLKEESMQFAILRKIDENTFLTWVRKIKQTYCNGSHFGMLPKTRGKTLFWDCTQWKKSIFILWSYTKWTKAHLFLLDLRPQCCWMQ